MYQNQLSSSVVHLNSTLNFFLKHLSNEKVKVNGKAALGSLTFLMKSYDKLLVEKWH